MGNKPKSRPKKKEKDKKCDIRLSEFKKIISQLNDENLQDVLEFSRRIVKKQVTNQK